MAKEKQIIVGTFDTKNGAKDALRALKYKMVKHGKGMVLSKSEKGKVKVKDTFNWGVFAGAFIGASVGDAVSETGGNVVGGLVGGLVADKLDRDFPKDQINGMAQSLAPDHSMIILLTNAKSVEKVENVLTEAGGHLLSHPISADLMPELEEAIAAAEAEDM